MRIYLEFEYRRVLCCRCGAVKQELMPWLAGSGRFTKRFERVIGRQCRELSVARVAEMNNLGWDQVRRIEKNYMGDLLARHPLPRRLRAIGIDEISIRKRHTYAVVVADLDRQRPVWIGGTGRSEADLARFFDEIGSSTAAGIRVAVMDMWPPFRKATQRHAVQAELVYDKFHILRHLADALDAVRRSEYRRASERERRFIKGTALDTVIQPGES